MCRVDSVLCFVVQSGYSYLLLEVTFINVTRNKILPQGNPKNKKEKKKLNPSHSSLNEFVIHENKVYLQLVQNGSD